MAADQFTEMTDEELEAIVSGKTPLDQLREGKTPPVGSKPRNVQPTQSFAPKDTTYGSTPGELALAGAGKPIDDLVQGVKRKAALATLPKDEALRKQALDTLNARAAEKAQIDTDLMTNPEAIGGNMGAQMLMGAAGPTRVGAQALMQGTLEGLSTTGKPTEGLWGELAGSATRGGLSALSTGVVGKLAQMPGRAVNAAGGRYTPFGDEAMATSDAARRLGMPPPSIGELDPSGALGMMSQASFGRGRRAQESGSVLRDVLEGGTGRPAGAYEGELKQAIANKFKQGSEKYRAVDDFRIDNGLGGVSPMNTYDALRNADPSTINVLMKYKPDAFNWARDLSLPVPGQNMQSILAQGVPLSKLHEVRQATNQAWKSVAKAAQRDPASAELLRMEQQLNKLRQSIDADSAQWAAQNAGNKEAMGLYTGAKNFWQEDVVPSVINNSVARRLTDKFRPYETGADLLGASTSNRGTELVSRLLPTGSSRLADTAQVLRGLPEATRFATSGKVPTREAGIGSLLSGSAGSVAAEMGGLSRAEAIKRLYFARNPEGLAGRATFGAAQIPAQGLNETLQEILSVGP